MIFYALVAIAAAAAVAGYMQTDTHVMWVVLGLATLMYAVRNTKIRMNAPYAAVVLCLLCAVTAAFGMVWYVAGYGVAAAAAVLVLVAIIWMARVEVPVGVRVMRVVFRGR